MKNVFIPLLALLLAVSSIPTQAYASSPACSVVPPSDSAANQFALTTRLNEINAMDKSEMTFQEKKELRQETRTIQTSLHDGSGGVYISVGALLILILILIILL